MVPVPAVLTTSAKPPLATAAILSVPAIPADGKPVAIRNPTIAPPDTVTTQAVISSTNQPVKVNAKQTPLPPVMNVRPARPALTGFTLPATSAVTEPVCRMKTMSAIGHLLMYRILGTLTVLTPFLTAPNVGLAMVIIRQSPFRKELITNELSSLSGERRP